MLFNARNYLFLQLDLVTFTANKRRDLEQTLGLILHLDSLILGARIVLFKANWLFLLPKNKNIFFNFPFSLFSVSTLLLLSHHHHISIIFSPPPPSPRFSFNVFNVFHCKLMRFRNNKAMTSSAFMCSCPS